MDNHYGGVIWTNHALDRLKERGIKQGDAWATWRNPQQLRKGTVYGSWVYYRNWGGTQIEVVAKKNEKKSGLFYLFGPVLFLKVVKNLNLYGTSYLGSYSTKSCERLYLEGRITLCREKNIRYGKKSQEKIR